MSKCPFCGKEFDLKIFGTKGKCSNCGKSISQETLDKKQNQEARKAAQDTINKAVKRGGYTRTNVAPNSAFHQDEVQEDLSKIRSRAGNNDTTNTAAPAQEKRMPVVPTVSLPPQNNARTEETQNNQQGLRLSVNSAINLPQRDPFDANNTLNVSTVNTQGIVTENNNKTREDNFSASIDNTAEEDVSKNKSTQVDIFSEHETPAQQEKIHTEAQETPRPVNNVTENQSNESGNRQIEQNNSGFVKKRVKGKDDLVATKKVNYDFNEDGFYNDTMASEPPQSDRIPPLTIIKIVGSIFIIIAFTVFLMYYV